MFCKKYECGFASYAANNMYQPCDSDLYIVSIKKTVQIVCSYNLRKIILNQMVLSATSLSQLKNTLVSTLTEVM